MLIFFRKFSFISEGLLKTEGGQVIKKVDVSVKKVIANESVTPLSRSSNFFYVRNSRTFSERPCIALLFTHAFLAFLFLFFHDYELFQMVSDYDKPLMKVKTDKCIINKWTGLFLYHYCVRGTRTQPVICVGYSVRHWVSCAIKSAFP